MNKKSILNLFVVGAGNGVNAVLGLMFFTAVARTLSIEDFGRYALLTSLLVSLSKIMDFGTNSVFVAKSITKHGHYVKRLLSLRLVLFIVAVVVSLAAIYFLELWNLTIVPLFVVGLIAYGLNMTMFAYFQRLEMFTRAVSLNFIPASIKAVFAIFTFTNVFTPNLMQAFGIFSLTMLACLVLIPLLPKEFRTLKIRFSDIRDFFVESVSAGISQLIKEGWLAISNSLAKIFKTFTDVGVFSLANKIADIFSLVSLSIFTVLLPENALRKSKKQKYNFKETMLLAFGVFGLAIIAIVAANYLVVPIFGSKFVSSLGLINILIFASAITAIHSFMDNFFFVEEKTNMLLGVTVTKLFIFVFSTILLTPALSLYGIAYANLISATVALILTSLILWNRR